MTSIALYALYGVDVSVAWLEAGRHVCVPVLNAERGSMS